MNQSLAFINSLQPYSRDWREGLGSVRLRPAREQSNEKAGISPSPCSAEQRSPNFFVCRVANATFAGTDIALRDDR